MVICYNKVIYIAIVYSIVLSLAQSQFYGIDIDYSTNMVNYLDF